MDRVCYTMVMSGRILHIMVFATFAKSRIQSVRNLIAEIVLYGGNSSGGLIRIDFHQLNREGGAVNVHIFVFHKA